MIFPTPFQTWFVYQSFITYLLNIISQYFVNWLVPRFHVPRSGTCWRKHSKTWVHKPYPISDQIGHNWYPISGDKNGQKTIPFGAAHTYIAYIREYPPPPLRETILRELYLACLQFALYVSWVLIPQRACLTSSQRDKNSIVCYTAVFSLVTQRSSLLCRRGALRDEI